jgi:hypothetical protein
MYADKPDSEPPNYPYFTQIIKEYYSHVVIPKKTFVGRCLDCMMLNYVKKEQASNAELRKQLADEVWYVVL